MNAAVQPILDRYISRLLGDLEAEGFSRDLLVMNGNGGTVSARLVARDAAKTVMSGPASGVTAAATILKQSGLANAITYDMGGTSTDVALIHGGMPEVSSELTIDYGLPIHVPMVDVRTVGAGGGSIAWINAAGMLQVGPELAGSSPGPICYGRGGTRPTITDAHLLLGRLDPAALTGTDGAAAIEPVRAAIERDIAQPLGLSPEDAAAAILRLANAHMAGAIRLVSLSRGFDPRDFVLFAFGGAGPLHAVAIARELGIPEVVVPALPGLTNALGCLVADLRQDFVNTVNAPLDALEMGIVARNAPRAARRGRKTERRRAERDRRERRHARRRHAVPRPDASDPDRDPVARRDPRESCRRSSRRPISGASRFASRKCARCSSTSSPRSSGGGRAFRSRRLPMGRATMHRRQADRAALCRRRVARGAGLRARTVSSADAQIDGPAIIQQFDATTVIEPGATATLDAVGNLRIRVGEPP